MNLSEAVTGQRLTVVGVAGDDPLTARLMEMGLTPGCQVALIGTAPLGDPIEIEVRHYRLSLRRAEAERVEVRTLE